MKNATLIHFDFANLVNKQREQAPLVIKVAFREALEIFLEDPDNQLLRNHLLETPGKNILGFGVLTSSLIGGHFIEKRQIELYLWS